jgi:hypothetical protein
VDQFPTGDLDQFPSGASNRFSDALAVLVVAWWARHRSEPTDEHVLGPRLENIATRQKLPALSRITAGMLNRES